ncbi:MAG: hypothetical protein QOD99_3201 [Chthoniobacter sp.]|nr:hypothetical protein [Chthoniobacter sp.]
MHLKEKRPIFFALALAALSIALYLPMLRADFVWDARSQILTDTFIHQARHFWDIVSLRVLAEDVLDNNRPANLLSLMIDAVIWGKSPAGYHFTNLLLHAGVVAMLFRFCARLLIESGASAKIAGICAAFGALLFAVHPLNCEPVSEVSYREDLLAAAFILAGMLCAWRFAETAGGRRVALAVGSVLCFFTAVAAKEIGVAGPAVLALYWSLFRRNERRWLWIIIPALVAVGVFTAARFLLEPKGSVIFTGTPHYPGGTLLDAMLIQPRIWAFYFRQILLPQDLCADYGPYSVRHFSLGVSLVTCLALGLAQIIGALRDRVFALGAALFWLALLPVSNLIPIYRPMADRFLYLPMIALVLMLCALLARVRWTRRLAVVSAIFALGIETAFGAITFQRESVWANSLALWSDTAQKNPTSYSGAENLGFALLTAGQPTEAIASFTRARRLLPKEADPLAGMALAAEALGRVADADACFKQAVERDARYAHPEQLVRALTWEKADAEALRRIAERN